MFDVSGSFDSDQTDLIVAKFEGNRGDDFEESLRSIDLGQISNLVCNKFSNSPLIRMVFLKY